MTPHAILPAALASAQRRLRPETIKRYAPILEAFAEQYRDTPLAGIRPSDIEGFCLGGPPSPSSARVRAAALRKLFRFAVREGHIAQSPCHDLSLPKPEPRLVNPYTDEEISRIKQACRNDRDSALVLTLLYTGLRISDAITLRWSDIQDGRVRVVARKNSREILLPIPEDLGYHLEALPHTGEYVFWTGLSAVRTATRNAQRRLAQLFEAAGVSGAYAHRARHTFATRILSSEGATMEDVAAALGITTAVAEAHYAKWSAARNNRLDKFVRRTW